MAIEITLTFGKNGLRISQKLDSSLLPSSNQNFVEQKRLKADYAATQASYAASDSVLGGAPEDPGGRGGAPEDPGGPGGVSIPSGSSGTVSIIGPIVITTCSCLKHDHDEESKEEGRSSND